MGALHRLDVTFTGHHDLTVTEVRGQGLGDRLGIDRKDKVLSVNDTAVVTMADLRTALDDVAGGTLKVEIDRKGTRLTLFAEIEDGSIDNSRLYMSTLLHVEGHRITEERGLVSGTGSRAGTTGHDKLLAAYDEARAAIEKAAIQLGANAVIGLQVQAVSSSIGGAFGDAVSVLVYGTAVVVTSTQTEDHQGP